MKNRMIVMLLALVMVLAQIGCSRGGALTEDKAQTPSEAEPQGYRLSKVTGSKGEEITLLYEDEKTYLPSVIQQILKYRRDDGELYKRMEETHLSYDEHGWVTSYSNSAESFTCSYDKNGNIEKCIHTDTSGKVTQYTYTYDKQGYVESVDISDPETEDAESTVSIRYENTYAEDGRSFVRSEYEDGQLYGTASFTCNENGQIVEIKNTADDTTITRSITYDSEGRVYFISTEYSYYSYYRQYNYYPLLTATETFQDMGDGDVEHYYNVFLDDNNQNSRQKTNSLVSLDNRGWSDFIQYKDQFGGYMFETFINNVDEPQVILNENSYLTRVEGNNGEYLEFTYEPVG